LDINMKKLIIEKNKQFKTPIICEIIDVLSLHLPFYTRLSNSLQYILSASDRMWPNTKNHKKVSIIDYNILYLTNLEDKSVIKSSDGYILSDEFFYFGVNDKTDDTHYVYFYNESNIHNVYKSLILDAGGFDINWAFASVESIDNFQKSLELVVDKYKVLYLCKFLNINEICKERKYDVKFDINYFICFLPECVVRAYYNFI